MLAAALGGSIPAALPAQSGDESTTAQRTCEMLEAAYAAAIEVGESASPVDVRTSERLLVLERFVPDYVESMALRPGEFEDLRSRSQGYRTDGFRPRCAWVGTPTPVPHEDHPMWVSFTRPIFSTDERLALVEVSFLERGGWGYGKMCIVRRADAGWSARCLSGWIA